MAVLRRPTVAVAAVVLLLCLSSAAAVRPKSVEEPVPKVTQKHIERPTAAASNPQHAPQFPDEPSAVRRGQVAPAIPTPTVEAPLKQEQREQPKQQQQPKQEEQHTADAPAARRPAAEAPTKVTPPESTPTKTEPQPAAPKQQQQLEKETPKSTPKQQQQQQQEQEAPKPAAPKQQPQQPAPQQDSTEKKFLENRVNDIEPKDKEEKEEEEDPCKRVPGCMACTPHDPKVQLGFSTRRLQQKESDWGMQALSAMQNAVEGDSSSSSGTKGDKKQQKHRVEVNFLNLGVTSPYDAKDLPVCTQCNTTAGYVSYSRGRCACSPGFGDLTPTGVCKKCPNGYFSQGGFRAVCIECDGVAFSNVDHTACVCASGWYGVTSYATKQASCNQCPGSRPVSAEGARASSECRACPTGEMPNEIYSACVDPSKIPAPEPELPTQAPDTKEESTNATAVPPLFNSSTFENAKEDWKIVTRNTQNHSNPLADLFGSLMDSVVMGKNVTATAKTPGELLYQMLTKPAAAATAPPKLPSLPNIDMQNPAQIGAGVGAALSTLPGVLGGAVANGGKISDVVDTVKKAVEEGSKASGDMNGASNTNGWDAFLKGLSATAPKDSSGKSEVADLAKSLGDLFGAAGKVATEVAEKSDNTLVKSIGGLLSAAKKGEDIQGPLTKEAALIAAPDPDPKAADSSSSWSNMLTNMLSGAAASPSAAAPATPEPAPANDWAKMFAGFAKGSAAKPEATATPAAAQQPGTTDIAKMLASLAGPQPKPHNPNPHTLTAAGMHYVPPEQTAATGAAPSEAASAASGLLSALAKYSSSKADDHSSSDSTQKAASSTPGSQAGGLGGLLGLFQKQSGTFSLANLGGAKQAVPVKVQQSTGPAEGFISVPSAPPKGSSAIKSGKFGFGGKAKAMKHGKAKAQ